MSIANNSIYGCPARFRAVTSTAHSGGQAHAHGQRHRQRKVALRHHQPVRRHQAEWPRPPDGDEGFREYLEGRTIGLPG